MAISPQKLLPSAGSTGIRLSSSIVRTSNLGVARRVSTATRSDGMSAGGGKLVPIYETLLNINGILSRRSKEEKVEVKRKKETEDKREKKKEEEKLELGPQKKKIDLPKVRNPFASFFDRLKNALVLLFVGWLVNTFFEYIPKILEGVSNFMKTLEDIRKFLKPATNALGSALYSFTLAGTKMLGAITGAQIDKNEKDLAVAINELDKKFSIINALMAGIVIGDIFSAVADGLDLFERPGRTPSVENLPRNMQRSFLQRGARTAGAMALRGARNIFGRGAVRVAGKVFGRIPIIGGLIDFIINLAMGEKPGRAAAKAVGATVGAGLGTLIPVPFAGTILGGFLGDLLGGAVYDMFAPKDTGKKGPKKKTEKPKGYFFGGLVSGVKNFFSGKPKSTASVSRGLGSSQKAIQQQGTSSSNPTISKISADPQLSDRIGGKLLGGFTEVANLISSTAGVGPFAALGISLALGKERFSKSNALGIAAGIGNLLGNPLAISIYNFLDKTMPGLGNLVQKVVGRDFGIFLSNAITQFLGKALYATLSPLQGLIKLIMYQATEQAKEAAKAGPDGGDELSAADLASIKASGADKKAAAHLATLEASAPQHAADVFQVILNRAKTQSGGIAAVITAKEQFTPYSAALYGGSPGDPAASKKYGGLRITKKELFELANKTDGLEQLVKRFGAGNASVAKQILADFEQGGPLSQSSKKFVGGAQYFLGYSKGTPDERRRPDGGNFFRDAYGGGEPDKKRSGSSQLSFVPSKIKMPASKPSSVSAMSYPGVSQFASYDRPSTKIQPIRHIVYVPINQKQSNSGGMMMEGGGVNNVDYKVATIKAAL